MDEAEYCDRIAIMDQGRIIVLDTPEALKASVGKDRVQISTPDDPAAIAALRERFEIDATVAEGAVTFGVSNGEEFVPRLFAELGLPIRSVSVSRPSLDDVFMSYTGTTIRDAEATSTDHMRNVARMMAALMAATETAPTPTAAPPTRSPVYVSPRAASPASCARSASCGGAS